MKYLILVTDGAADEKIDELGGKTPLESAKMENINRLAKNATVGLVKTIPKGMEPGSDVANLSVMGYDPKIYHTGRSPLEAVSMGINMNETDVAFRCNIVTLKGEGSYEEKTIVDHSSGDISTEEAKTLIEVVNQAFSSEDVRFYHGVSYRHAMIVHDGKINYKLTPPHDILEKRIGEYLPKGEGSQLIEKMMRDSYKLLSEHPVNLNRINKGQNPGNSIWIWGQGRKPALTSFYDKYSVKGATISAVDLIKGIGVCAGLDAVNVPGATGTIHTNFEGKAYATIEQYENGQDFVYLHLEAPDECSHQGDVHDKIRSLELIDSKIVGPVLDYLDRSGEDYRFLVLPDHQTPISIRTHAAKPVPFVLYDSTDKKQFNDTRQYGEGSGAGGMYFDNGYELTDHFFKK